MFEHTSDGFSADMEEFHTSTDGLSPTVVEEAVWRLLSLGGEDMVLLVTSDSLSPNIRTDQQGCPCNTMSCGDP
jgi:hypothetical protein